MPVVIIDQVRWDQLEQVQHYVNDKVRYVDDMDDYGKAEFWEIANTRGDCEDFALAKRERLLEMGWPAEALRMATAVDERGELHAVLTVDVTTPAGRRATYVLDNRFADVEPWQQLSYRWLERQGPSEYAWNYLGNPTALRATATAVTMNVAMAPDPLVAAAVAAGMAATAAPVRTTAALASQSAPRAPSEDVADTASGDLQATPVMDVLTPALNVELAKN